MIIQFKCENEVFLIRLNIINTKIMKIEKPLNFSKFKNLFRLKCKWALNGPFKGGYIKGNRGRQNSQTILQIPNNLIACKEKMHHVLWSTNSIKICHRLLGHGTKQIMIILVQKKPRGRKSIWQMITHYYLTPLITYTWFSHPTKRVKGTL